MKDRIRAFVRKWLAFFLNPHLLFCFALAWMITNGWSYLFLLLGTLLNVPWMTLVGGGWLTLLWLPFTPEKLITVSLAILFLRLLFPQDTRTLAVLREKLSLLRATLFRKRREKGKCSEDGSDGEAEN